MILGPAAGFLECDFDFAEVCFSLFVRLREPHDDFVPQVRSCTSDRERCPVNKSVCRGRQSISIREVKGNLKSVTADL